MQKRFKLILLLALAAVLLACSTFGISQEESGAFLLETNIPLTMLENAIENSVELSQVEGLQMELREGYIFFTAASVNFEGVNFRDLAVHLELYVEDGELVAEMTNGSVAGRALDDVVFVPINKMIAERLSESQTQIGRAELLDVSISPDGITLLWRINRSSGGS